MAEAVTAASRRGKSIGISSFSDKQTNDIHNAKNGDTVHVPAGKVEQFNVVTFGYVTAEQLEMLKVLSDRVDRILGMDDADRGKVTGVGTATEVSVANIAQNEITSFVASRFRECAESFLMTVLWYLYHEKTVEFALPMTEEERQKYGVSSVRFKGGIEEGKKDSFDQMNLEIQQFSMQRMSEGKRRQKSNDLINLLQVIPAVPQMSAFLDVESYFKDIGVGLDIPDLGELVSGKKATDVMNAQMNADGGGGVGGAAGGATPLAGSGQSSTPLGYKAGMNQQSQRSGRPMEESASESMGAMS